MDVDLEELTAVIRIEGTDGINKAHAKARMEKTPLWRELANRWLRRSTGAWPHDVARRIRDRAGGRERALRDRRLARLEETLGCGSRRR
jgi:hypothetical protein